MADLQFNLIIEGIDRCTSVLDKMAYTMAGFHRRYNSIQERANNVVLDFSEGKAIHKRQDFEKYLLLKKVLTERET